LGIFQSYQGRTGKGNGTVIRGIALPSQKNVARINNSIIVLVIPEFREGDVGLVIPCPGCVKTDGINVERCPLVIRK
jgi:hypothetical protein